VLVTCGPLFFHAPFAPALRDLTASVEFIYFQAATLPWGCLPRASPIICCHLFCFCFSPMIGFHVRGCVPWFFAYCYVRPHWLKMRVPW